MSHYARTIKPLDAWTVATHEKVTLGVDTEIKCVKIVDGEFRFEARVFLSNFVERPDVRTRFGSWLVLATDEDLPAFTDKGSAHRARRVQATLQRGRPAGGEEPVKPVAVRLSTVQRLFVERRATRKKTTVSEYIRTLLEADGMPR